MINLLLCPLPAGWGGSIFLFLSLLFICLPGETKKRIASLDSFSYFVCFFFRSLIIAEECKVIWSEHVRREMRGG